MGQVVQRDFIKAAQDGYPLSMRLTTAAEPRFALLVSAGTGYPKGFYDRFAKWMASQGGAVLTYDFRGTGGSRPQDLKGSPIDLPDWGHLDAPAALDALIEAAPGLPVTHVGHSVGGHLVGLMPNQDLISRHVFVSVGTGWWGGHLKSYWLPELGFWWVIGPYSLFRHGYIKGSLWGGTDLPRRVYTTWRRWSRRRAYFAPDLGRQITPHHYEAVTAPIHSWLFTDDPIATPQSSDDLMRLYPHAPKTVTLLAPADLGRKRIGHDGAFRAGTETLWQEFLDWLQPSPS
jgi:predicted alpha/beta hydrolase